MADPKSTTNNNDNNSRKNGNMEKNTNLPTRKRNNKGFLAILLSVFISVPTIVGGFLESKFNIISNINQTLKEQKMVDDFNDKEVSENLSEDLKVFLNDLESNVIDKDDCIWIDRAIELLRKIQNYYQEYLAEKHQLSPEKFLSVNDKYRQLYAGSESSSLDPVSWSIDQQIDDLITFLNSLRDNRNIAYIRKDYKNLYSKIQNIIYKISKYQVSFNYDENTGSISFTNSNGDVWKTSLKSPTLSINTVQALTTTETPTETPTEAPTEAPTTGQDLVQ